MERPGLWQRRIEKRAARIRKKPAKRHKARQRNSISKTTLIDTLFNILGTHNVGALGQNELTQLALLRGFQRYREQLYEGIDQLLDIWGSTHALRFPTRRISMLHFRRLVSRTGNLHMSKAELRRTIRYSKSPEISGPLPQYEHSWRGLKYMKIFTAAKRWKQGIMWHYNGPSWFMNPKLCSDPNCPCKPHPEYLRGM